MDEHNPSKYQNTPLLLAFDPESDMCLF